MIYSATNSSHNSPSKLELLVVSQPKSTAYNRISVLAMCYHGRCTVGLLIHIIRGTLHCSHVLWWPLYNIARGFSSLAILRVFSNSRKACVPYKSDIVLINSADRLMSTAHPNFGSYTSRKPPLKHFAFPDLIESFDKTVEY